MTKRKRPREDQKDKEYCGIEKTLEYRGMPVIFKCIQKRGHGPGGLYCKQHAKMKGKKTCSLN